ncbi:helix-turn-helix domain-containing protein [Candidatus Poriferisodalis sp.]|uniref:helix-turn-helix domain-containing protein n=1 Tax=Candidatus Poriferisodalis sp. TaxID=3101277 RepID=UPI003C701E58
MGNERTITVRQLLASPVLTEAELLAGEAGLNAAVAEVVLYMRLKADSPLLPGEVVVLDAAGIGEHFYQIDMAIRTVADAGAASLVVTNSGFELGLGVRRLANRFDVPLVVVPEVDAMTLTHRLRTQLWASDVEHASAVHSLLATLSRTHAASVERVLDAIASLSASRVFLLGQDRSLVAGDAVEIGARRLASDTAHLVDNSTEAALHSTPIILTLGERDEEADYWLMAECAGSQGVQRLLRSLMLIGSWYLAALLSSARARTESDARRRIAVLNELLATSDLHERDIRNQMLALGWSAAGWNTGLHIKLRGANTSRIIDLHAEVRERLREVGMDGPLVERNDGWSGWITDASEPAVETYSVMVQELGDALEEFVDAHSGLQAHAGIGRPYLDLSGLRRSLAEAHEAALIANARFGGRSGAAHIDQLGVQRVLMGWFGSDDFARYARFILQPVLDVDSDHELARTLEVYLDASCSTTEAAQMLGLHRNTVANRMRRIAGLLGVALDDAETRLSLQLACRMLRINREPSSGVQNALQ